MINPSHVVCDLSRVRQYPPFTTFVRGLPKVQPAEDMHTMMHARLTISLVVRVISRSKNNFYDVIRLKIIESRYFPKETVKVGLEKSNQNGGQLKETKCHWISSAEISNLNVDRGFSRLDADVLIVNAWFQGKDNIGLGRQWPNFGAQTMDRLREKVGGESHVKSRNKYLIK